MRSLVTSVLFSSLTAAAAPASAAGDAAAGHALAQRWCASCHIVDRTGQGRDTAPPFPAVANRNPEDRGWLRAWLTAPHPPMPNFNLSRQQIDDGIAYLRQFVVVSAGSRSTLVLTAHTVIDGATIAEQAAARAAVNRLTWTLGPRRRSGSCMAGHQAIVGDVD